MIELRPVVKQNWRDFIKLTVSEDQKNFVADNLYSIAQAQFGFDFEGHWDCHPFGIYDDDTPVGFMMYAVNFSHPVRQVLIARLMVDQNVQRRGYGRAAMEKVLESFRADGRVREIGISYEPENEVARKLYAELGFVETGEIIDDEVLAVLRLR